MDSPPVSWALATWVVPVVPALWFAAFVLVAGGRTAGEREGYATGLALAVVLAVVGSLLRRTGPAPVRGLGWGLVAGGLACAVPSVWVMVA